MRKIDVFFGEILSSNKMIFFFGISAILSVIMAFLSVETNQLKTVLQSVASLNITIAIGLGAITISLDNDEKTLKFLKEIILIMLISILSYFIPFWADSYILRGYLLIAGFSTISILLSVSKNIDELIKKRDTGKIKNDTAKKRK